MHLFSAGQKLWRDPIYICTVIATIVSWDCVESRHKIVDDFFVSATFSFKSESMDVAEACHAAAWKGNMWRITLTDPAIMGWTIFQTAFIEKRRRIVATDLVLVQSFSLYF